MNTNNTVNIGTIKPKPDESNYFGNQNEDKKKKRNGKKAKKKHVCAKCGAGFSRAYDLKLHLKKHSDPRLKCTYCDLNFAKREGLERHIANKHRHTELEVYVYCSICRQKYRRRVDLWKHMKIDHNIILDPPKLKGPKQRKHAKKNDKAQAVASSKQLAISGGIVPSSVKSSDNLDHNSRSILKYLMQSSPVKPDKVSGTNNNVKTDSLNNATNVPTASGNDFSQGTVFVKTVQIENNGPLLGQRLLKSPSACLSTPEKDMMHIENSGSFSDISDNYSLPKGITVTPFHVNKYTTANTLLPFEQGFSIGESKKYSLNFGLCPDLQLPENFMAESPENSLEGRISPNKPAYISRERTPVKQLDTTGRVEREFAMELSNSTETIPNINQRDIDVITIDSDSNISAKSLPQTVDSDVEVLNISDDEESKMEEQSSEKENLIDICVSRKKRKHSDSDSVGISQQSNQIQESNISIITYQAVSPMKIAKTVSQEKCNIGRKLLLNNHELSQRGQGIDNKINNKDSHKESQLSQGKTDTEKSVVIHANSSIFHTTSSKTVSVCSSTSRTPPKITLFPTLQYENSENMITTSSIAVSPDKVVSNSCINGIYQPVIFKSHNRIENSDAESNSAREPPKPLTYTSLPSQPNNISVKEVTLDKSGPSLFGKLSKNISALQNNVHDHGNKVLVIGSSVSDKLTNVTSKLSNSGVGVVSTKVSYPNETINDFSANKPMSGVHVSSALDVRLNGTTKPTIIKNNYQVKPTSSEVDHLDPSDLESFYHSQEVKQTLRSIVTQPCASELLRAKREKLTIDDIYEEKIAKLLDKIGLNTFKGVPISQYFSGSSSIPKRSHVSKDKMLGKDTKEMDPNQKLRHQEQIRARVASFIAMLERNKKERKPVLAKDQFKDTTVVGTVPPTETVVSSKIVPPNVSSSHSDSTKESVIIKDQSKPQSVNNQATGVVFDGVFKVPTKCAPSVSGSKPVKVVIKNNLPGSNSIGNGIVTNCLGNLDLTSVQLNQPVQTSVISNQIPTIAGINCNGIVNNLVGGVSIATLNLSQPLTSQVIYRQPINNQVSSPTNVLSQKVILSPCVNTVNKNVGNSQQVNNVPMNACFAVVNQSKVENRDFPKEKSAFVSTKSAFHFKSSALSSPCLSPIKTETSPSEIVNASVKPVVTEQIQAYSPLKISTRVEGSVPATANKLDQLNISTSTGSPTCKLNPISPKSDSQQSLPEVDFLSGISSATYQQSLVSPTKLINGNSCSNDSISPIKEGSLLNIQDINPAELQALMASPIKSFDMDNSNLSTASQNELLETLHNFLKDVPKSVSPQKGDPDNSPPKISQHISPGKSSSDIIPNSGRSFNLSNNTKEIGDPELISTSVNLTNLFSSETHRPSSSGGKFFKHITNNVQVSIAQPSCSTPSVSPSLNYYIPTSPSYNLSDESNQEGNDVSPAFNDDQSPVDKLGQKCDGDDCDIDYVPKPLVVNAPELHDENTMDRIVSVVEDLKAYSQT